MQVISEQFSKTCVQRHTKNKEWVKNNVESAEMAFSKSGVYPFLEEQYLQLNPAVCNFPSPPPGLDRDFWVTVEN